MIAWVKLASDFDMNPKVRAAGHLGASVFLFALRRHALRHASRETSRVTGAIPRPDLDPVYVASMIMVEPAEASRGLERAIAAGLLDETENGYLIVGYTSEWTFSDSAHAERQKRYRERQKVTRDSHGDVTRDAVTSRDVDKTRLDKTREEDQSFVGPSGPTNLSKPLRQVVTPDGQNPNAQNPQGALFEESEGPDSGPGRKSAQNANSEVSEHSSGQKGTAKTLPEPPAQALTVASLLLEYLVNNNPSSKLAKASEKDRESTLLKWAHEIRLLHDVDRQEYGLIQSVVHWSQRDNFWRSNILSAGSLRSKFDMLVAQKNRPRGRVADQISTSVLIDEGLAELKEQGQ